MNHAEAELLALGLQPVSLPDKEAFAIVKAIDVEGGRHRIGLSTKMPDGSELSDEGIALGLHKLRLHCTLMPMDLRLESLAQLRKFNVRGLCGENLWRREQ